MSTPPSNTHAPAAERATELQKGVPPEAQLGPADLSLRLLSQPRHLCGARDMVGAIARKAGFSEIDAGQIALALDEALANVIRHGYDNRPDGPIWINLWMLDAPAGLHISVEDNAKQVDPCTLKGRDLEDIRPGGLGIHIIGQIMDRSHFEHRENGGMRLVMSKLVSSGSHAEPPKT